MSTCAEVIAVARYSLNDVDGPDFRNTDTELLRYLNDGLAVIYQRRPELLFPNVAVYPSDLTINEPFPLSRQYEVMVTYYIVWRAEIKDDEHVNSGRAVAMQSAFENELRVV